MASSHQDQEHELSPSPAPKNSEDRLRAIGINVTSLLSPEEVARRMVDEKSQHEQEEIDAWQSAVESVNSDTAVLRERLEARLKEDVESGRVESLEEAEKRLAQIDAEVAKGPARSWTYNGHRGDKWHRSQTYYVTVDENGNVWGEFEAGKHEIGITGKPVSPGKHVIHKNPSLSQEEKRAS